MQFVYCVLCLKQAGHMGERGHLLFASLSSEYGFFFSGRTRLVREGECLRRGEEQFSQSFHYCGKQPCHAIPLSLVGGRIHLGVRKSGQEDSSLGLLLILLLFSSGMPKPTHLE